jgi:hypothetical protein
MNLYAVYAIIAPDHRVKKNYILSSDKNSIVLPVEKIINGRFLHNEIMYYLKKMFSSSIGMLIEHMELSYIEVQNQLCLNYIDSIDKNNKYSDDDVFLLVGLILDKNHESHMIWKEFEFKKNVRDLSMMDQIIDFTIKKTII